MSVFVAIDVAYMNACALQFLDLSSDLRFDMILVKPASGCASRKADDALTKMRPGIREQRRNVLRIENRPSVNQQYMAANAQLRIFRRETHCI